MCGSRKCIDHENIYIMACESCTQRLSATTIKLRIYIYLIYMLCKRSSSLLPPLSSSSTPPRDPLVVRILRQSLPSLLCDMSHCMHIGCPHAARIWQCSARANATKPIHRCCNVCVCARQHHRFAFNHDCTHTQAHTHRTTHNAPARCALLASACSSVLFERRERLN